MTDCKLYFLCKSLKPDTKICQYMTLNNFLCLLERTQYYVKLKKSFSDKYESQLPIQLLFNVYQAGSVIPDEIKKRDFEESKNKYNQYRDLSYLPTACWTKTIEERATLWRHFTPLMGIRITSTIDRVVDSLDVASGNIHVVDIKYNGYDRTMNAMECLCSKTRHYSDENEVRFYFKSDLDQRTSQLSPQQDHILVPVNLNKMIDSVTLSPDFNEHAAKNLCVYFKERYGIRALRSQIEMR